MYMTEWHKTGERGSVNDTGVLRPRSLSQNETRTGPFDRWPGDVQQNVIMLHPGNVLTGLDLDYIWESDGI
jgi:hypothetical protein